MHQTFVKDFIGVHLAILRHMSKKQAVQVEIGCSPQLYISYVQVNSSQEMKQPSSSQCKCIVETAVYAGDNCFCLSLPVKLLSSHHHCITAVMYASRSVAVRHVNVLLHWVCYLKWLKQIMQLLLAMNKHNYLIRKNANSFIQSNYVLTGRAYICWEATDQSGRAIPLLFGIELATGFNWKGYRWKWIPAVCFTTAFFRCNIRSSSWSHSPNYFFCTLTF